MAKARVTIERAREIVKAWAARHGYTQAQALNLALISRKVMNERDFTGRFAYLERLFIMTGHDEFRLTPNEKREQQKKQAQSGIDYELRRNIAQFLVSQWRETGKLSPERYCLNLPGRAQNSVDEVIRTIRHSPQFKEFLSSRDEDGYKMKAEAQEIEELLKESAVAQTEATVALFEHLFRTRPEIIESLVKKPSVKRLAQLSTILMSGNPNETYEFFREHQGNPLAFPSV